MVQYIHVYLLWEELQYVIVYLFSSYTLLFCFEDSLFSLMNLMFLKMSEKMWNLIQPSCLQNVQLNTTVFLSN